MAFAWSSPPPRLLPQSSHAPEVHAERQCLASRFSVSRGSRSWSLTFTWICGSRSEKETVPCGLNAQILFKDGRVLRHPSGKNFVVPVRGGCDVEVEGELGVEPAALQESQAALRRAQWEIDRLRAQRQTLEGRVLQQEQNLAEAASRVSPEV